MLIPIQYNSGYGLLDAERWCGKFLRDNQYATYLWYHDRRVVDMPDVARARHACDARANPLLSRYTPRAPHTTHHRMLVDNGCTASFTLRVAEQGNAASGGANISVNLPTASKLRRLNRLSASEYSIAKGFKQTAESACFWSFSHNNFRLYASST